jgi:hypothetical protein
MRRRSSTAAGSGVPAALRLSGIGLVAIAAVAMATGTSLAGSPIAQIGTPLFSGANTGFEQIGVGFGFSIPTFMPNGGSGIVGLTQQNGFAPSITFQNVGQPNIPFGLGPTTPGASLGYSVKGLLGANVSFGITASEGSNRGMMSGSPSVTVMDGGTGFVSDTSQSPFVTGVVPVVGDGGSSVLAERLQRLANGEGATTQAELPRDSTAAIGPAAVKPTAADGAAVGTEANAFSRRLAAAQDSSAGQPVASLAEIRAQQAAEDQAANEEYRQKIQLAEAALADGKPGVARIYYQQVVRHGSGTLKQQAIDALKNLVAKTASPGENSETGSAR